MDGAPEDAAWTWTGLVITNCSLIVRIISFACLGLGLVFSLPFILLIIFDIFLWVWRSVKSQIIPEEPGSSSNASRSNTKPTDATASCASGIDGTSGPQPTPRR